jgi:acetyl esterase/lipase
MFSAPRDAYENPPAHPAVHPPPGPRVGCPDETCRLHGPERPRPPARIAYGPAPSQYAELFVPSGAGPFPVAVLVHGGCWTEKFGGITQLRNMAGALRRARLRGLERRIPPRRRARRRLPRHVRGHACRARHPGRRRRAPPARPERVVAVGHSAGGQLVQWIAGRSRIPAAAPVPQQDAAGKSRRQPRRPGRPAPRTRTHQDELRARHARAGGLPSAGRPDVYADTNAAELMPNGSHTILVTGELDTISPPRVAHDYAARARAAGDSAEVVILPGASHYDEVAASSASWPLVAAAIERALARSTPNWLNPPRQRRVNDHVGGRHGDAGQQVVLALFLDRQAGPLDEVAHAAGGEPAQAGAAGAVAAGIGKRRSRPPRGLRAPWRRRQESCSRAAGA